MENLMLFHRAFDPIFAACKDEKAIAETTLQHALRVTGTVLGNVQLADWSQIPSLSIVAQEGFQSEFLNCFKAVSKRDHSACGRALLGRRTVVITDVLVDDEFRPYRGVAVRAGFRSVQSTPLLSRRGSLLGVLSTHSADPDQAWGDELDALRSIAEAAADAIIRCRTQASARYDIGSFSAATL